MERTPRSFFDHPNITIPIPFPRQRFLPLEWKAPSVWIAWFILAAGFTATWFAWDYVRIQEAEHREQELSSVAGEVRSRIVARLHAHAQLLRSAAAFMELRPDVSRADWKRYVESLNIELDLPGIQGVGFAAALRPQDVAAHEAMIRRDGFPAYTVHPTSSLPLISSIILLEPFSGRNLRAFGYDMYSEPVRRAAMEHACDENAAVLSGRVRLVQETEVNVQHGTLMYVPVYRTGLSQETVQERRAALRGWVYSPYRMNDLMQGILSEDSTVLGEHFHLRIAQDSLFTPDGILYDDRPNNERQSEEMFRADAVPFNGTVWFIQVRRHMHHEHLTAQQLMVTAGGAGISILLFVLYLSILNANARVQVFAKDLRGDVREMENRIFAMADSLPNMVWIAGLDMLCTYFNSAWLRYTGRAIGQELGNGWTDNVHPDDREQCMAVYRAAFADRQPFAMEYRLRKADGSYGWLWDMGRPMFTVDGTFLGYIGSCTDISQQKQTTEELRTINHRLNGILDGTKAGTWEWNVQTGETVFNERWAEIIGYTLKELEPLSIDTWTRLVHPDDLSLSNDLLKRHIAGEIPVYDCECRMRHKDGSWVWVHDRGSVFSRTEEGMPLLIFGTHADITVRKRAEEALIRSSARFRSMFDHHSAVMMIIDPSTGVIVDVNDAAERFYGYSRLEMCGMSIGEINMLTSEEITGRIADAKTSTTNRFEFPHRLASGEVRQVEVHSTVIPFEDTEMLFSIVHDITDRKRTAEQLQQSEEKFRHFFVESADGITMVDEDGKVIEWNTTLELITGIPKQEAMGRSFIEIQRTLAPESFGLEQMEHYGSMMRSALLTGEAPFLNRIIESKFRSRSGELRSVQQMTFPIRTANGYRLGMISRDMTDKARLDEVIRIARQNFNTFFNTIDDFLFVTDDDGTVIYANETVPARLGYTAEELTGRSLFQFHPQQDREEARRQFTAMLTGELEVSRIPLVTKGGIAIPVEMHLKRGVWDGASAVFGAAKDITRLQFSEAKFSKVFYLNPSACGFTELGTGKYVEVNDAFLRFFGFTEQEVIGHSSGELGIITREAAQAVLSRADAQGRVSNAEAQLRTKSGELKHVLLSAENIDVLGITYRFTVVHDITEIKKAQIEISSLALRQETFLRTASDGIHVLDEWGNVVEVNDAFCTMLGYSREELLRMNVSDWDRTWSSGELRTKIHELIATPAVFETQHRRKDGALRVIEVNCIGVQLEDHWYLYASARDITERKSADEALRHAQKLESIGTLAGGVAHDFNNILVGILGQASRAMQKLEQDHPARLNIQRVVSSSERASLLTRQLLAYAGKGKYFVDRVDLNRAITENLPMIDVSIPKTCELVFRFAPSAPMVSGDTAQIQQVVLNLLINAGEAIGKNRGTIEVETLERTITGEDRVYSRLTNIPLAPGRYGAVRITDTGTGIPTELVPKIFDPFFSTKFTGRGLGLAAVLGIIRSHHAGLLVESVQGKGTTFEVIFPIAEAPSDVTTEPPAVPSLQPARRSVLVIDDEPIVIEVLQEVLTAAGYTAVCTEDPRNGIALFRERPDDFSLVVLDYSMPVMNGQEVFRELTMIRPDVNVLLCSGYTEEQTFATFGSIRPAGFFQKPYHPEAFTEKVRQLTAM